MTRDRRGKRRNPRILRRRRRASPPVPSPTRWISPSATISRTTSTPPRGRTAGRGRRGKVGGSWRLRHARLSSSVVARKRRAAPPRRSPPRRRRRNRRSGFLSSTWTSRWRRSRSETKPRWRRRSPRRSPWLPPRPCLPARINPPRTPTLRRRTTPPPPPQPQPPPRRLWTRRSRRTSRHSSAKSPRETAAPRTWRGVSFAASPSVGLPPTRVPARSTRTRGRPSVNTTSTRAIASGTSPEGSACRTRRKRRRSCASFACSAPVPRVVRVSTPARRVACICVSRTRRRARRARRTRRRRRRWILVGANARESSDRFSLMTWLWRRSRRRIGYPRRISRRRRCFTSTPPSPPRRTTTRDSSPSITLCAVISRR